MVALRATDVDVVVRETRHILRGRATDKEEAILKRLGNARGEIMAAKEPGLFDVSLVNDNLDRCYGDFSRVLAAEVARCRASR